MKPELDYDPFEARLESKHFYEDETGVIYQVLLSEQFLNGDLVDVSSQNRVLGKLLVIAFAFNGVEIWLDHYAEQ